jgi:acyl-CoA synthetase (AMP-forming)/AMP-acid ligase II
MSASLVAGSRLYWAARQHRDRVAVAFREQTFTYADIERRSNQLAHALLGLDPRPGNMIAVLLNNSPESIHTQFAAEKAAQTYVPLNARHTVHEHAEILRDAGASVLIVGSAFADIALQLRELAPSLRHVIGVGWSATGVHEYDALLARSSDQPPLVHIAPELPLRVHYTSGTTGKPKGVVYSVARESHRIGNQFHAMEYSLGIDDAMLHVGPLTHAAGMHMLPCYLRGAMNVVVDRFDAAQALALIESHRITQLMVVPTMLTRLLEAADGYPHLDLSSLKRIHYGTAPTPVNTVHRALERFGPILRQQYGMIEAIQPLCVLYPHEHLEAGLPSTRVASCGRPTLNVDISVRNGDGLVVPVGDVGEIALANCGVGRVAFWRRPDLERSSIRDGWFYTGDLGYFDEDGFLYIVGRTKDLIISGGFNVYAREVEETLLCHPAVAEAAVLGVPDPEWGEAVAAFVVLRPGERLDADALKRFCGARIAGYKKPKVLEFVDDLPRNQSGKVTKITLRDRYLAHASSAAGGQADSGLNDEGRAEVPGRRNAADVADRS